MKNVLICVCTLMPLLCVASASNNALRSFSSSSSKQRNLKDKLPSMCTGEQDSCTCKDFLANLKAATFQAANKTAWDKYQALSSYQKVLETEDTDQPTVRLSRGGGRRRRRVETTTDASSPSDVTIDPETEGETGMLLIFC